jgi:hypothetical protein
MKIKQAAIYHRTLAAVTVAALMPSIALASTAPGGGEGVFGLIAWFNRLFTMLAESLGLLGVLIGTALMVFGIFQLVQHFRTESRDDPSQKSRLVFGVTSFLGGALLAFSTYNTIGEETNFQEAVTYIEPASSVVYHIS